MLVPVLSVAEPGRVGTRTEEEGKGTVTGLGFDGQVHVSWDNGNKGTYCVGFCRCEVKLAE